MIIQAPSQVAFNLFDLPVYWYGIIMSLAVLVSVVCAEILADKNGIKKNFFIDNSPLIIIVGLLGARLYYCVLNAKYYILNPLEIFYIRQGGLSIHGMLIIGILYFLILAKINRVSTLKILDISACSVVLGQSVGRWGNFFNSEAFGLPTYSDWGLFIPENLRPEAFINYELFHPTFFYESLFDFLIFFILLYILRKQNRSGRTFFAYLILYSVARILIEFVRIDSVCYLFGLPIAQVMSFLLFFIGVVGLIYISKRTN